MLLCPVGTRFALRFPRVQALSARRPCPGSSALCSQPSFVRSKHESSKRGFWLQSSPLWQVKFIGMCWIFTPTVPPASAEESLLVRLHQRRVFCALVCDVLCLTAGTGEGATDSGGTSIVLMLA